MMTVSTWHVGLTTGKVVKLPYIACFSLMELAPKKRCETEKEEGGGGGGEGATSLLPGLGCFFFVFFPFFFSPEDQST